MIGLALALFAIDGDTMRDGPDRLRLFGIDAPEMSEAGGEASKRALAALIAGQTLACYTVDTDRYGRAVVICYLPDGRDVSCVMVSLDHARDWPRYSGGRYAHC
jgi:endonuclease YncB( thermonuclease family)